MFFNGAIKPMEVEINKTNKPRGPDRTKDNKVINDIIDKQRIL